jgi:hypothetical protein
MATDIAVKDGVSLNHFISLAVAEKIARLEREARSAPSIQLQGRPAGYSAASRPEAKLSPS